MDVPVFGLGPSASVFEIGGRRFEAESAEFARAIADAYVNRRRPCCLCKHSEGQSGIEMYVARLSNGYIVKRMPNTGYRHAPDCPSYEPPAEATGLGQVLGSAITEDPATGETSLKLGFALSKLAGRANAPAPGCDRGSVTADGTRLSLRGLLHYLWDQAELTHWLPGFDGKRSWGTVRRHLLQAAENKTARGDALGARLYIPEVFSIEERVSINARRMTQWLHAITAPGKPQQLMLLIAEVKEIVPSRYGHKVVVKHVPDQSFALDEKLYRRLGRAFETELALWGASDDVRMILIATFSVAPTGVPTIVELSLMPATRQWLPVEDGFEKQLIERLVAEGRRFVKGLRYHLGAGSPLASATLTDGEGDATLLVIDRHESTFDGKFAMGASGLPVWSWIPTVEQLPVLPVRRHRRRRAIQSIAESQ